MENNRGTLIKNNFPGGFTVLMAVYKGDSSRLLGKAIQSVFDNSLRPAILVLTIDGPLPFDTELEIEKKIKKFPSSIKLIRSKKNEGLASALNNGIKNINTEWIVRADADDINHKDRFLRLANHAIKNPQLDLIGSQIREINLDGETIGLRKVPLKKENIYHFAKKRNPFNHMSVAYKKSAVIESGLYPNLSLKEDYGLWVSMINKNYNMENIDEILVDATVNSNFYLRRGGWHYIGSEFKLQKMLCRLEIKSFKEAICDFLLRSFIFMMPSNIRGFIYINLLRVKDN